MRAVIRPVRQLIGETVIPGDKSISHRGVMLGAIARGTSRLSHFLAGDDCLNTIKAFQQMGIRIELESVLKDDGSKDTEVIIQGKGLHGLKTWQALICRQFRHHRPPAGRNPGRPVI